ncbi:MAG: hypothetical protein H0W50_09160 [Parachlamydiaceae bacterium]|nr:hypothetical protein [Parachlamydiaceae bacterium]
MAHRYAGISDRITRNHKVELGTDEYIPEKDLELEEDEIKFDNALSKRLEGSEKNDFNSGRFFLYASVKFF